jgi:ClpP class serine protease
MQGKHANIMSAYYDWKPSELELCNKLADESYKEFVTKYSFPSLH